MAGQVGLAVDLNDMVAFSPDDSNAKPKVAEGKKPQDSDTNAEERRESTDEDEKEDMTSSALLEAATLPWPGGQDKKVLLDQEDNGLEEKDATISQGGSHDLSEEGSQAEGDVRSKAKWRESMPEGDRWRDDEIELQKDDKGDGSLADDEDEKEEKDKKWIHSLDFTPRVTIVCPTTKELPEENQYREKEVERELQREHDTAPQFYREWEDPDDKDYIYEHICSEKLRLVLATAAAALVFPLLVWGGYALLPFDSPQLESAPLRVLYTLRCACFATIPIMLGVVVQGIARLRFSANKPLYQSHLVNKEVLVHWHYVNESLSLFLFYFLQLAVMATYISQDLVKLVPLLTITFVFGRLIYWICLALDSCIRGFGFGFSFFPMLVMLGANLYYVCSSVGQGSIFDVAPPATDPPPRLRWWF
ncbi:hypothetical protein CRENBAI_023074 [Crenichthys baileyi]|uniref:Transmembrane protein 79 n=1 Tax=Crenichthys baileyi TaxID=28760 RepID=A0AAV9RQ59_9TELE